MSGSGPNVGMDQPSLGSASLPCPLGTIRAQGQAPMKGSGSRRGWSNDSSTPGNRALSLDLVHAHEHMRMCVLEGRRPRTMD